jgi:hypothetical protein
MGKETLASLHKSFNRRRDCPAMNGTHCFKIFKDYDFLSFKIIYVYILCVYKLVFL